MFAEKLLANVVKAEMLANNSDPEELLEKFVPVGMVSRELVRGWMHVPTYYYGLKVSLCWLVCFS